MFESTLINRETVIWAYKILLGREPENENIINSCMTLPNIDTLRKNIINSEEFKRLYLSCNYSSETVIVRCNIAHGLMLYIDLADQYVSLSCLKNNYEPSETSFIGNFLQPGYIFVDIGANIGWHTINAAHKCGSEGHVFAFEPRDFSRKLLKESIADNGFENRISLYEFGIGRIEETVTLKWAINGVNPGGATIDPTIPYAGHSTQSIYLKPLDSFGFNRIDLIKIDIEGAELLAVQGAIQTLKRCRPIIVSEIIQGQLERVSGGDEKEYLKFMQDLGFNCYSLCNGEIGNVVNASDLFTESEIVNVVFVHKEVNMVATKSIHKK